MSQEQKGGSDMGAAFAGLIGGSLFIGAILYGIVILTNNHFKSTEAEHKSGVVASPTAVRVG